VLETKDIKDFIQSQCKPVFHKNSQIILFTSVKLLMMEDGPSEKKSAQNQGISSEI
jgi:hypothetical protein